MFVIKTKKKTIEEDWQKTHAGMVRVSSNQGILIHITARAFLTIIFQNFIHTYPDWS